MKGQKFVRGGGDGEEKLAFDGEIHGPLRFGGRAHHAVPERGSAPRRVKRQKLPLAAWWQRPTVRQMKTLSLMLCGLLAGAVVLRAQVSVEMVVPQDKLLPAEQFLAGVKVVNRSGQPLHLGDDADWIQFVIENADGTGLAQVSNPPVQKPFVLESSQQGTLKVDLAPCFDLRRVGKYWISAVVKFKDWNSTMSTKSVAFEVIEGTKLWEQVFGVPSAERSGPPEVRKYTLQQANYLKEPRLYLRISSADGGVIKIINLGPLLAIGQPEPLLDRSNRLHLLHQTGARVSTYYVINTDGDIESEESYEYVGMRPRLQMDEAGKVTVKGGTLRNPPEDAAPVVEPKKNVDAAKTS
jgi:hypothetical protein